MLTHTISDVLIGAVYFSIPLGMGVFPTLVAIFIMLGGVTHFNDGLDALERRL